MTDTNGMKAETSPTNATSNTASSIAEHPVDSARPLQVCVAGAGVSGIIAAIKLQKSVQGLDIKLFEKNEDLGGTWFENRYPGCACDIPAHIYQLSWESNVEWSQFYASQGEILKYWQRVAEKYDLRKLMLFSRRVIEGRWHEDKAKWELKVENMHDGSIISESCDIFITAVGKSLHPRRASLSKSA